LQQLKHRGERAHGINAIGRGLVIARVLLRDKQDLLVRAHHFFKRGDRLLASHEQRHDHVREYDNVAQRQDRIELRSAFFGGGRLWFGHCSSVAFFPGGTVEALRRSIFRPPLRTASSPTNAVRCRGGSVVGGDLGGCRQVALLTGSPPISCHSEEDSPLPSSRNQAIPRHALVPSSSWRSE